MSNLKATTVVDGNSIFTEFKGALTEQYVLQQLILRYEPYYYAKTNSTQEIDFLLQDEEDEIVPLEVKAETNVKAKSLRQFVADNQSKKAYRISMNDYRQEDWVTNVPLYAVNGLEFYSIQNESFLTKTQKKSLKNLHKREILLIFAAKKDGKGNISLSVISHKSCNNS